jgi:hypothetical protein
MSLHPAYLTRKLSRRLATNDGEILQTIAERGTTRSHVAIIAPIMAGFHQGLRPGGLHRHHEGDRRTDMGVASIIP